MRFAFIRAEKATYPVRVLCRVLEVSVSGFYQWLHREPSARSKETSRLKVEIWALFAENKKRYGSPRIWDDLRELGWKVGKGRVERLMREMKLQARPVRRFVATTHSKHALVRYENHLNRDFTPQQANKVWAGDITYLRTTTGWLYLAVLLDLYSRRVVGSAVSDRIDTTLTSDALRRALRDRPAPALHHSDQGSQYAARHYQQLLHRHHIKPSMSRRANCWDNAPVESFFSTLKTELAMPSSGWSPKRTQREIQDYLHWYNHRRKHTFLNYLRPAQFEHQSHRQVT